MKAERYFVFFNWFVHSYIMNDELGELLAGGIVILYIVWMINSGGIY